MFCDFWKSQTIQAPMSINKFLLEHHGIVLR